MLFNGIAGQSNVLRSGVDLKVAFEAGFGYCGWVRCRKLCLRSVLAWIILDKLEARCGRVLDYIGDYAP